MTDYYLYDFLLSISTLSSYVNFKIRVGMKRKSRRFSISNASFPSVKKCQGTDYDNCLLQKATSLPIVSNQYQLTTRRLMLLQDYNFTMLDVKKPRDLLLEAVSRGAKVYHLIYILNVSLIVV